MSSPPVREGPHEKGYMAALAAHVQLYGSVDETTLHLVAFPPGMTTKPHDSARVMEELAPAYGLRYAALPPPTDVVTYSATKAAAYSITQALAQELAPHDVRVLSVHPGPVRTEMLPERLRALAAAPSTVAEEVIRALADGTPLHVFPDPHAKQLAKIMQPFLTKVVEGGDVYNQGK